MQPPPIPRSLQAREEYERPRWAAALASAPGRNVARALIRLSRAFPTAAFKMAGPSLWLVLLIAAGQGIPSAFAQTGTPCSASAPACNGTCSGGGEECVADDTGVCVCVSGPVSCAGSGVPACYGGCPSGQRCAFDAGRNACLCTTPTPCGNTYPACDGSCSTNAICVVSRAAGCTCEEIAVPATGCAESQAPACGGDCPHGFECLPGTGGASCACVPVATPCGSAQAPECNGACSGSQICRLDAAGACSCASLDPPCSSASAPACAGLCPDGALCALVSGSCVCRADQCANGPYPECGGSCPAGSICQKDSLSLSCICVSGPVSCTSSAAPLCGGECPAGQECRANPLVGGCLCQPNTIPCGQAQAPLCAGECPEGQECAADAAGASCLCVTPTATCGAAAAPACNGFCASGQLCRPTSAGNICACVTETPPCGATNAPVCGGACPPWERCTPSTAIPGTCGCRPCDIVVPGFDTTLRWATRTSFYWGPIPCAETYNVYRLVAQRLTDGNHDGLADNYGSCFQAGLTSPAADDPSAPPPGSVHYYLPSGESPAGEGSLGLTSSSAQRLPNITCP